MSCQPRHYPAPAQLCNSLFGGLWLKPMEIKRLFNSTCPWDGPELSFSEHRRPQPRAKPTKLILISAAESHSTTVLTRSDKCSSSLPGPLLWFWFIYTFTSTVNSRWFEVFSLWDIDARVDFWTRVPACHSTRLVYGLSKEACCLCVNTRESHYAKSISS